MDHEVRRAAECFFKGENAIINRDSSRGFLMRYICTNGTKAEIYSNTSGYIFESMDDAMEYVSKSCNTATYFYPKDPPLYLTVDGTDFEVVHALLKSVWDGNPDSWNRYKETMIHLEEELKHDSIEITRRMLM